MTDNVVTRIVVIAIVAIVCTLAGGKVEQNRIMAKCLEHSETMPYYEAAKQCKEMVE